jgi:hypothetical protein
VVGREGSLVLTHQLSGSPFWASRESPRRFRRHHGEASSVSRPAPERTVLLLGIGTIGARVAALLQARADVRLVGVFAKGRGVFDWRGVTRSVVAELAARRPCAADGPASFEAMDFPASTMFLDALSRRPDAVMVDCTTAIGTEQLYADARARAVTVLRPMSRRSTPEASAAELVSEIVGSSRAVYMR